MKTKTLDKIVGPRAPADATEEQRQSYRLPAIFMGLAALSLVISIFFPYWILSLDAPQYPDGLRVETYINRLEGDVQEIDGLNHYIGMRPLDQAAQLERSLSIVMVGVTALLVLAATFIHTKWVVLLALPAILYPIFFVADMYYWLRTFGQNLDPTAAMSSFIEPFIPPLFGSGKIGQFDSVASFGLGFFLACLASILVMVGLYFHRRAYKPLVDSLQTAPLEAEEA